MTDKELRHLSRFDLIDIIYELQKQNDASAEQRAAKLNAAAERKARAMIAEANAQIEEKWAAFEQRTNELISAWEELQALIKKDSK